MLRSNPEALRSLRERNGHTARSLSRQAKVSHPRISQLEAESVPVRPTTAKLLADALGVEITDITVSDGDPVEVAS